MTRYRYSTAAFNIITSVIIIALPIPLLLRLKHHRPEVKQLIGLVLLGLIHTSLTIARFVIMFFPNPWIKTEPQYGWVPAQMLAVCEMDANILFATLVVMRPALQAVYLRLFPRGDGHGMILKSSRTDSVIESALERFQYTWGRRAWETNRNETSRLETVTFRRTDVTVNIERRSETFCDSSIVDKIHADNG